MNGELTGIIVAGFLIKPTSLYKFQILTAWSCVKPFLSPPPTNIFISDTSGFCFIPWLTTSKWPFVGGLNPPPNKATAFSVSSFSIPSTKNLVNSFS